MIIGMTLVPARVGSRVGSSPPEGSQEVRSKAEG